MDAKKGLKNICLIQVLIFSKALVWKFPHLYLCQAELVEAGYL